MNVLNAMAQIRKHVFRLTQAELAEIIDASQATISRWETGESEPPRDKLAMIREEARRRKIKWRDDMFFAAPIEEEAP